VVAFDRCAKVILFNDAARRMFGYDARHVLGRRIVDLLRPSADAGRRSLSAAELRAGVGSILELRGRRASGSVFTVEASVSEVDAAGEPVYFTVLRDVSDRKHLEARMTTNESLARRLFDSNIVGVAIAQTTGEVLEANDAFLRTTGYDRSDMPLRWDHMTPPEWRYTDVRAIEEVAERGVATPWEKEYVRKDGTRVPVLLGVARLEGSEQQVIGFTVDLTELKREETARRAAEARAGALQAEVSHAARLSAVGEMASGLAHELHQPLGAIANYIDGSLVRLEQQTSIDLDAVAAALRKARNQAERAALIIRSLRAFVRGRSSPHATVDVNDLVRAVEPLVAAELRVRGVRLRLELSRELPPTRVETVQIEQVVLNLVLNAAAAVAGLPLAERLIVIATRRTEDGVELVVRDRGCGFSKDVERSMFEPFFTTRPDGIGLGLAISRSIVEAHGGRIWAESSASQGTAFHFTLPATDDGEAGR
jgi:PAS domain S-box-containing protein